MTLVSFPSYALPLPTFLSRICDGDRVCDRVLHTLLTPTYPPTFSVHFPYSSPTSPPGSPSVPPLITLDLSYVGRRVLWGILGTTFLLLNLAELLQVLFIGQNNTWSSDCNSQGIVRDCEFYSTLQRGIYRKLYSESLNKASCLSQQSRVGLRWKWQDITTLVWNLAHYAEWAFLFLCFPASAPLSLSLDVPSIKIDLFCWSCSVSAPDPRAWHTVFIGEEDTMVNKILVVDKIVHLGPPLGHCRGLLYRIVW